MGGYVNKAGDKPWIIPNGSTVHGRLFTGTEATSNRILRVEAGGSAYFTVVSNGWMPISEQTSARGQTQGWVALGFSHRQEGPGLAATGWHRDCGGESGSK